MLLKLSDAGVIESRGGSLVALGRPRLSALIRCLGFERVSRIAPGTYKVAARPGTRLDVAAAVGAIKATGEVQYAGPNHLLHAMLAPNDEQYTAGQQWGLTQVKAEQAWDITTGSDSVVIAVLDTGTASDHPDLSSKVVSGYDFVNSDDYPLDDNGHGTFTAGIAAAASNNQYGIAGVAWSARIMPVKVLSSYGNGTDENISQGMRYAVDHGAKIINASLGGDIDSQVLRDAVQYAADHNVLIVASAGNTPDGRPNYPAAYDSVLSVGSTGRGDTYAGFSSWGAYVDVTAPGVGIISTSWDRGNLGYEYGNGTSASSPIVSGIAALVWSVNPALTAVQVRQIIEGSADDLGDPGWDERYGVGRVNAFRAVKMAQAGPPPVQTPSSGTRPPKGTPPGATPAATQPPGLRASASQVSPGQLISLEGGGFAPDEYVDLLLAAGTKSTGVGNAQADSRGAFRAELALPRDAPPGPAMLSATGEQSGFSASVNLTVLAGAGQSRVAGMLSGGSVAGAAVALKPALGWIGQERATRADNAGKFSFAGVSAGTYALYATVTGLLPAGPYIVQVDGTASDNRTVNIRLSAARPRAFEPVGTGALTGGLYFPEAHHTLRGEFLRFWEEHGGLAIFGYPISEEYQETNAADGRMYRVQYFERNRFEYHPELAGTGNTVLMGLLGNELTAARTFQPGAPFQSDSSRRYFPETRHSLGGAFLTYWKEHGGLAVFGYPTSEELMESGYLVQYFERNRFEYHPEYANSPGEVLLGLLGVELARRQGWIGR